MTPNVEQVFLSATNDGEQYEGFMRVARMTRAPILHFVGDYRRACYLMWHSKTWLAVSRYYKLANVTNFSLTADERIELAYCLAVHFAEHLAEGVQ